MPHLSGHSFRGMSRSNRGADIFADVVPVDSAKKAYDMIGWELEYSSYSGCARFPFLRPAEFIPTLGVQHGGAQQSLLTSRTATESVIHVRSVREVVRQALLFVVHINAVCEGFLTYHVV